jgi:hypothetical protein
MAVPALRRLSSLARPAARPARSPRAVLAPRSLAHALAYENDGVIHKFLERHDIPLAEARSLFRETKKWLWLAARAEAEAEAGVRATPQLAIDGPLTLLDEMWHTFILFTREYTDYCHSRFGRYVHHLPTTLDEKQRRQQEHDRAPTAFRRRERARLRAQYSYVCEHLGEQTLRQWYSHYARRYTPQFVRAVTRAAGAAADRAAPVKAQRELRRSLPPAAQRRPSAR